MKIEQALMQPAFPCFPVNDKFGRTIAPIPGVNKLEYFALKIYLSMKDEQMLNTGKMKEAIKQAMQFTIEIDNFFNESEKSESNIVSM
jgi:hypothetical protein